MWRSGLKLSVSYLFVHLQGIKIIDKMQKIEGKKKFFKGSAYSKSDPYYRKAKCEGYRARSAYKLL